MGTTVKELDDRVENKGNSMSPIRMSRKESKVRAVLEFYEAFNRHDVPGMMELLSDDCVFESAESLDGRTFIGKEEISQFWQDCMNEKPHVRFEGEDIVGVGIRCIMRWKFEWEYKAGEWRHIRGVDIFQFKKGLICKQYSYVKGFSFCSRNNAKRSHLANLEADEQTPGSSDKFRS